MAGLLRTIETPEGQTFGLIRENGQVEDVTVVPGGGSPIGGSASAVYFVDQAAPAGGNGSILAPFNTFADAFTAAGVNATATGRPQTIWCTPGNYSGEGNQTSTAAGFTLTVVGWNIGGDLPNTVATGPTLPNISLTGAGTQGLNLIGCAIGTADVTTGEVTLQSGSVASAVTCDVLKARDSQAFAAPWSATTSADFANCVLGAGAGTTPLATFRNCPEPAATMAITGAVQIDALTNAWQKVTATTTLTVVDRPGRATISVVVPAVADGQVGYVDTALTGELAALTTGDPIIGNPTADLVAAGAGGGYVNCRVSAPGTVRCAFIGALAGGAVNFTFSAP